MSLPLSTQWRSSLSVFRLGLLALLLVLLIVGALPGYLKGSWFWQSPPPITVLQQLKTLRQQGLALPGWQMTKQRTLSLGDHIWSVQESQDAQKNTAILFLFTQNGPKDQPQVEWTDLNGLQQWETDSQQSLSFAVPAGADSRSTSPSQTIPITAQLFRAWNPQQTYAVLQWYAWPTGGDPTPSRWFMADRWAQLHRQRQPWVAVSALLEMEPLDDLSKYRDRIETLGKTIQSTLLDTVFTAAD
ncbi:cyanoexosortase B system-associated protein [Alkalinema sp. FACHB-956]|uniref:cyanoexosortase B system-associated protein n=1 Tax=Alkalinema sp. FACHB-956 TaxID=2692768 RepID=UPI0016872488|nr:cyanoexosortase B system-associated protein [Alkalinema sp. FACHB-956]MBD2326603.1 cyanoexosortase B system-associated protein [Alkalinema sp. FACHB-956]